jgi:hypothetical protein
VSLIEESSEGEGVVKIITPAKTPAPIITAKITTTAIVWGRVGLMFPNQIGFAVFKVRFNAAFRLL